MNSKILLTFVKFIFDIFCDEFSYSMEIPRRIRNGTQFSNIMLIASLSPFILEHNVISKMMGAWYTHAHFIPGTYVETRGNIKINYLHFYNPSLAYHKSVLNRHPNAGNSFRTETADHLRRQCSATSNFLLNVLHNTFHLFSEIILSLSFLMYHTAHNTYTVYLTQCITPVLCTVLQFIQKGL